MLATTQGPALLIGTPRGHNWAYNLFQRGWGPDRDVNVESFHWTIYDTPYVTKEWIAETRLSTPERLWRQEYLAEFLEDGGEVFRNIDAAISDASKADLYTVMGVDLARTRDFTVIWVTNSRGGVGSVEESRPPRLGDPMQRFDTGGIRIPNEAAEGRFTTRRT